MSGTGYPASELGQPERLPCLADVPRHHSVAPSPDTETGERLFTPRAQFSGQMVNIGASIAFYLVMRTTVPPERMVLWIAITIACLGAMFTVDLLFGWFSRQGKQGRDAWRKLDLTVSSANEAAAIATIVLLLPYANPEQRLFAVAYFIGYFPCSILSDPGNVSPNRRAVLLVLGAFALWLFLSGGLGAKVLAGVVVAYAAFMYYAMGGIAAVVRDAVAARAGMEQANAALNVALAEVSAERDAKTRFISAASHDLGQPLQAARLFAEQLGSDQPAPLRARAHASLVRALESSQSMLSHMLHYMRLEADAVSPHLSSLQASELLARLAGQFTAQAKGGGIAIRLVGGQFAILTDPVLLERALGNLIDNALTHSGGTKLLIAGRLRGETIELWIIDNGNGIHADEAATIFDDYVRGGQAVMQHRAGFGLGLASVSRLAKLLGGTIRLDPRWTGGAAFCLTLPRSAPA